jgi:DNA-binding LytR/AlgR family response regulator
MKIGICDDDSLFLELMTKYVKQYEKDNCKEFKIIQFINEDRLVEYLKKDPEIDILFLDVLLYQKNAIDIAKEIRKTNHKLRIVFVSACEKFAVKGYDVNAEVFYDNTDKGKILIDVNDLIYIETCERNTKIHTREDTYISSKKMKEHERLLQTYTFCRCHASYIVNLSYVRSIDGLSLFLKDGTEIQISKSRRGKFMEAFAQYVDSIIRF